MPQRRVATEVLKLRGTTLAMNKKKYAHREREPKRKGDLGAPPKHLSKIQRALWREFLRIVPVGVCCSFDRPIFELLILSMERIRTGKAKCADFKQCESILSRLGMTPSDRSRVQVSRAAAAEGADDPLAEFVQ